MGFCTNVDSVAPDGPVDGTAVACSSSKGGLFGFLRRGNGRLEGPALCTDGADRRKGRSRPLQSACMKSDGLSTAQEAGMEAGDLHTGMAESCFIWRSWAECGIFRPL